jgi:hypothetical protein
MFQHMFNCFHIIIMKRKAVSLVEYCVYIKTAAQAGLSGQVHYHGEFNTRQIPIFVIVYEVLQHRVTSTLVNLSLSMVICPSLKRWNL